MLFVYWNRCKKAGNVVSRVQDQQLQALPWVDKHPEGFRFPGNDYFNTMVLIAITIAASESEELPFNQSGNAIDPARTGNLRILEFLRGVY